MKKNEDKTIYIYRIILMGDSFVGKTSLIIRFCDDTFEDNGVATMGVDTKTKYVKRKDKKIELQIWDTAGQERFRALSKSCCNQVDGIAFVYDIGKKETFKNIKRWYSDLTDIVDFKKVGTVLVGNKCDIENREVEQNLAQDFSSKHNMSFIESSAKKNINVSEIFTTLVDVMIKLDTDPNGNFNRTRSKLGRVISTDDDENKGKKRKKKCC